MPSPKSAGIKADLVLVEWLDAHAEAGWFNEKEASEAHRPSVCFNVGWLCKKDKIGISLTPSVAAETGEMGEVTFIPAGMIKKVTVLKKAR